MLTVAETSLYPKNSRDPITYLNKCPAVYEPYMYDLPEFYKEIAAKEMNENETTIKEALEEMRRFVARHPRIKSCRTDPVFLLRFLRTRKYNVNTAKSTLEQYLEIAQSNPNIYKQLSAEEPTVKDLLQAGVITLLPERDSLGRRVILYTPRRIAPFMPGLKHQNYIRTESVLINALYDDQLNQVAGFVIFADMEDISLSLLSRVVCADNFHHLQMGRRGMPMRLKGCIIYNFNGISKRIYDMMRFMGILSSKMASRIKFLGKKSDLSKYIDVNVLPERYGGPWKMEQCIKFTMDLIENQKDTLYLDSLLDWHLRKDKIEEKANPFERLTWCFNKLEVD